MSKLIRAVEPAPPVHIGGDSQLFAAGLEAERLLRSTFPTMPLVNDQRGSKAIPIEEIYRIRQFVQDAAQKARLEGYQEGHKAGTAKGDAQAKKVLEQFQKAIADCIGQRETLLKDARQQILELVMQISRKVTFDAVQIDPETTLQMINGVIDTLTDKSKIKVKVHPEHLPIVQQGIEKIQGNSPMIKEIAIEADPRVQHGGCFIETPGGDIDARLESQFEVIGEILSTDTSAS